jgi:hypothetical protein
MSPNFETRRDTPVDESPRGTTAFRAVADRPIYDMSDMSKGADQIDVTVNREFVEKGQHRDEALALLGIDRAEMDRAWHAWAARRGAGAMPPEDFPGSSRDAFEARYRQDGAYWHVEAEVEGPERMTIEDLAFTDQRAVKRRVTYRARVWADRTKKWHEVGNAGYTHVEETRPLEAAAAVGMWYTGIEQADIDATARSIGSLISARNHLVNAHREITYALQVADKFWNGDRANAVKFHFGAELLVVEGIRDAVHDWEDASQRIHDQQRFAKDCDDKFVRTMWTELAIDAALLVMTLGAGTVIRAGEFVARLVALTDEFNTARNAMRAAHAATFGRMAERLNSVRLARAASWGTVNVGHAAAVRAAGGQELTLEDWVLAYGFALGAEGLAALRQLMSNRYGVGFRDPVAGERPTFPLREVEAPGPGPGTRHGDELVPPGAGRAPGKRPDGDTGPGGTGPGGPARPPGSRPGDRSTGRPGAPGEPARAGVPDRMGPRAQAGRAGAGGRGGRRPPRSGGGSRTGRGGEGGGSRGRRGVDDEWGDGSRRGAGRRDDEHRSAQDSRRYPDAANRPGGAHGDDPHAPRHYFLSDSTERRAFRNWVLRNMPDDHPLARYVGRARWDAGHVTSSRGADVHEFAIESRPLNQADGRTWERQGETLFKRQVMVEGIPIDLRTLYEGIRRGLIDRSVLRYITARNPGGWVYPG